MHVLTAEEVAAVDRCRSDPVWWARTVLGWHPWSAQARILESVRDNPDTSARSCHGAGKSALAAVVALWFLYNHRSSIVITTAPTARQVRGILWKEIGSIHTRAAFRDGLGGRLLTQQLHVDRDWFALGFTAPEYDPDRFQGFHATHLLAILDEAAGISTQIQDGVDGILASEHSRKLEIGNPTDPTSPFAKSFSTPGVAKFAIDAFQTPNFAAFGITEEDIFRDTWGKKITGPLPAPYLITPQYVARMLGKHGRESPWYQARVLAVFPSASKNSLIQLSWIEAAQARELDPVGPHELGVDVGRGGDPSVIAHRRGPVVEIYDKLNSRDTMEVTGWVARAMIDTGADLVKVDTVGIGAGVYDRLVELGYNAAEANAGARSSDSEKYKNLRAEWHWNLRERFEEGRIDIDDNEDIVVQASGLRWKPDSAGRVVIESKDDFKKRLGGQSPNELDAVAIAFGAPSDDGDDVEVA